MFQLVGVLCAFVQHHTGAVYDCGVVVADVEVHEQSLRVQTAFTASLSLCGVLLLALLVGLAAFLVEINQVGAAGLLHEEGLVGTQVVVVVARGVGGVGAAVPHGDGGCEV